VDAELEVELRGWLGRDDDYTGAGKPGCDYDDPVAREALVDALARDAMRLLACLDGRELGPGTAQAAQVLATVVGQDLETDGEDGMFRIARRVAKGRVVSTVDPDARHGHKTSARGFDGYKGHVAIDPDSEVITAITVSAGNSGDAAPASDLLADDLPTETSGDEGGDEGGLAVYGDAAYGAGELLAKLEKAGTEIKIKVQPPPVQGGRFAKDRFAVDLSAGTVSCPNGVTVKIRPAKAGGGTAVFGTACAGCPLAAQCTSSKDGRTVAISRYEAELVRARAARADPAWLADYKATRPKVERKIGHLMRRRHGGRRARVRGQHKVAADFSLLAAAVNLARFGALGLRRAPDQTWVIATI
jgi:hypothetical protein